MEKYFVNYYSTRGVEYEQAFEELLKLTGIYYTKLDDGKKLGAPDYLLNLSNSPGLVVELKSKLGKTWLI